MKKLFNLALLVLGLNQGVLFVSGADAGYTLVTPGAVSNIVQNIALIPSTQLDTNAFQYSLIGPKLYLNTGVIASLVFSNSTLVVSNLNAKSLTISSGAFTLSSTNISIGVPLTFVMPYGIIGDGTSISTNSSGTFYLATSVPGTPSTISLPTTYPSGVVYTFATSGFIKLYAGFTGTIYGGMYSGSTITNTTSGCIELIGTGGGVWYVVNNSGIWGF